MPVIKMKKYDLKHENKAVKMEKSAVKDVLSFGMFCPLACFVPWDVLSLGHFVPWDVLSLGHYV